MALHLINKRNFHEALSMINASIKLDPNQEDIISVIGALLFARNNMCIWPIIQPFKNYKRSDMLHYSNLITLLALSDDPALQLSSTQSRIERKYNFAFKQLAPVGRYNHDKIRIGYLSSDFRLHAVSILMVGLFEHHNQDKFETYGFCWSRDDGSSLRRRVISAMAHFISIKDMNDTQAAEAILANEIDILIDLNGLSKGCRPQILAHRPAPLQITYLGVPGTTGMPWIDYIIADRYIIPEESAQYFTEKPLYMPHCFQVSDNKREVASKSSRADYFLPEDVFVFCCFNNNYKFTHEIFEIWMRILKNVPNSVLWLLSDNIWAHDNLINFAKKHGIKKERLVFASRVEPSEYLARYQLADLFLDTFPFNGGTTANDALFMGLPLLTLSGRSFASRYAGSLLTNLGLQDLITFNCNEYEKKAILLATNKQFLKQIKDKLKEYKHTSPVFNTTEFVKSYEQELLRAFKGDTVLNDLMVANNSELNVDQHRSQALQSYEKGELGKAQALFKLILSENPNDIVSLYFMGTISMQLNEPETSLKYFDSVTSLNSAFPKTWIDRGLVLQSLERYEEALASYSKALEVDPGNSEAQAFRDALPGTVTNNKKFTGAIKLKTHEERRIGSQQLLEKQQMAEAWVLFIQTLATCPQANILNFLATTNATHPVPPAKTISIDPNLISIIIPCYNHAQFLREAVESVIAQTYTNFEIIIVNDGSPDDTNIIAHSLINEYPKHCIMLLEKANGGLSSARNYGISSSKGSYILTLDADDKIHPEMLQKCYALLNNNTDLYVAYTDYQYFGDADNIVANPEYDFQILCTLKNLHPTTALYRKKAWIDTGGYNTNMIWGIEDWDFWINCGKRGYVGKRIPEILFYYRAKLTQDSMLKTTNKFIKKLNARMFLNHQEIYVDEVITWATHFWSSELEKMLEEL